MQSSASSKSSSGRMPASASGHHRLAAAGCADEQNVVPAGCRNLQRALRHALADDVGEIRFGFGFVRPCDRLPRAQLGAALRGSPRYWRAPAFSASTASTSESTGSTLKPFDHRRLRCIRARQQNGEFSFPPRGDRDGQHAANRTGSTRRATARRAARRHPT